MTHLKGNTDGREYQSALARTMRAARIRRGITRNGMADLMGVSGNTITRWELSGGRIPVDGFIAYCEVINVDPADVISKVIQQVKPRMRKP